MKAIYEVIAQKSPFKYQEGINTLGLDCVSVASEVYRTLSVRSLEEMVRGRKTNCEVFGAFPLEDEALKKSVTQVYDKLIESIDTLPQTLLTDIVKSSEEMGQDKNNIFSINPQYLPFQSKEGHLQPVSTGDKKSGEKLFRAHLCKVEMKAGSSVHDKLQLAISNHYENLVHADDSIEKEDKAEALAEIKRQIQKLFDDPDNRAIIGLRELLDKETSGLVKREVGIAYLEYLQANAKKQTLNCQELEKIINNIRWVEDYIHHPDRNNDDCMYQVTDEHPCDLRELLGHADAFEK